MKKTIQLLAPLQPSLLSLVWLFTKGSLLRLGTTRRHTPSRIRSLTPGLTALVFEG